MAPGSVNDIVVLWVGRRTAPELEALTADYARRVGRHLQLTEVRIRPAAGRQGDARRALAEEAAAARRHLRPGDTVVALDEHGRERTTEELAAWLAGRPRQGRTVFVIGSDLGLDRSLRDEADETMALSRLTLAHGLARLVLFEQLYRVCDLLSGGRYHRVSSG
jgi:23S rRNA (pseudouridine1915-N3)-methyltransferase